MNNSVKYSKQCLATIDFPAIPTAYGAAGKIIKGSSDDLVFTNMLRVAGVSAKFISAVLKFGGTSAPPNAGVRLWLFSRELTVPVDGNAFVVEYATFGTYLLGYLDFTNPITASAGATVTTYLMPASAPSLPLLMFSESRDVYGILTTLAAWTPTAESSLTIDIRVEQN